MIAALLVVASISSSDIGDFFTLSNWVPTSVSAEYIPGSGTWTPYRRLTTNVLAAVNSTFEAYYERLYYASQGQTNVWDEAWYGSRFDHKIFRFDIGGGAWPGEEDVFNYEPTNRVIATRRFREYDNVDALAEMLIGDFDYYMLCCVERPYWVPTGLSHASSGYKDRLPFWSSQAEEMAPDADIVPAVSSWVPDPTYAIRDEWASCVPAFCELAPDGEVWDFPTNVAVTPAYQMMVDVRFGEDETASDPTRIQDFRPRACRWSNPDGYTMRDVIESNFAWYDGWAITNKTRRLIADRIGCVNQFLGLMDRTYHSPQIRYPETATNTYYENAISYQGTASVTNIAYSTATNGWELTFGPISWYPGTSSNTNMASAVSCSDEARHHRISETATGSRGDVVPTSGGFIYGSASVVKNALDQAGVTGDFSATLEGVTINVPIAAGGICGQVEVRIWSSTVSGYPYHVTVPMDAYGPFTVTFRLSRSYNYAASAGEDEVSATQPGWESGDRVEDTKYGAFIGIHERRDIPHNNLGTMDYHTAKSTVGYRSESDDYEDRADLLAQLRTFEALGGTKVAADYGNTPSDWQSVIPINTALADAVRDSARIDKAIVSLVKTDWITTVQGSYDGATLTVTDLRNSNSKTGETAFSCYKDLVGADFGYSVTNSPAAWTEREKFALDAKLGVLTRTDWQWHALRSSY